MRFHTQATNRLVVGGNRSVLKLDGYLQLFDRFDEFYDGSVNLYDSAETIQKTKKVLSPTLQGMRRTTFYKTYKGIK